MVSYNAVWNGILSGEVDFEYTSQRCPPTECQHTERTNRHKKRLKCQQCEFQDYPDRKAAVYVLREWLDDQNRNVPSPKNLPRIGKVRRTASGRGGATESYGLNSSSGVNRPERRRDRRRKREGESGLPQQWKTNDTAVSAFCWTRRRGSIVLVLFFESPEFSAVGFFVGEEGHCEVFGDGIVGIHSSVDQ